MTDERELIAPAEHDALKRALERLHLESYGWALACCGRRPAEAREVLHSVYVKLLDGQARFAGRSSFRTWLFGVIRRSAAEHRRGERLRWLRLVSLDGREPADPAPGAEERVEATDRAERLVSLLERLSRRQREVLELVFYHDLTVEEAAGVMDISVGSARSHYARGKERLRHLLGSEQL